jgi:predicted enzyme related to lactoylglutathione lyase
MQTRDGYPAGVPCWIDTNQPDPEAAVAFYGGLFGWKLEDQMPPNVAGHYFAATLEGCAVAAIGSVPEASPPSPVWNTYVWVQSADQTAAQVKAAGGTVISEPFDVMDAGRMAIFSDPSGAVFSVWQANRHRGAELVNAPGSWNWSDLHTADVEGSKDSTAPCSAGRRCRSIWARVSGRHGIVPAMATCSSRTIRGCASA